MVMLLVYNFVEYMTPKTITEVGVDISKTQQLRINFDFLLPGLNCNDFGLDFTDISGNLQLEIDKDITKVPLGEKSCRAHGHHAVNKVKGEFHIAFGRLAQEWNPGLKGQTSNREHIHRLFKAL